MRGSDTPLEGTVRRIVYTSPDGGFLLYDVEDDSGTRHRVTQKGGVRVRVHDRVRLTGGEISHPKFGQQYQAKSTEILIPETEEGIISILQGPAYRGIGRKTAEKIAELLKGRLTAVLNQGDPHGELRRIVGDAKAGVILESWARDTDHMQAEIILASAGLPAHLRQKIFDKYPNYMDVIRHDPYRLYREIDGIGFQTADRIARNFNLPEDSPERLMAGVQYTLEEASQSGHTGLTRQDLIERTAGHLICQNRQVIMQTVDAAIAMGYLAEAPNRLIQTRAMARLEARLAERLIAISQNAMPPATFTACYHAAEKIGDSLNLTEDQKQAVLNAMMAPVSILTGGPGTGKTRTIQGIIQCYKGLKPNAKVHLMAPTGIAAERASRAAGHQGYTIHKTLGIVPDTGSFLHNEHHPLDADLIIIDEVSMIGVRLMNAIIQASGRAHIVLVGDIHQLPSIECGRVLLDIIDSKLFPVTSLTRIFRQQEGSDIALGAAKIHSGQRPHFTQPGQSGLVHIETSTTEETAARVLSAVTTRIPQHLGIHPSKIQVLTPGHNSAVGTIALNSALQAHLNPTPDLLHEDKPIRLQNGHHARAGDPVLYTENDPTLEIYNGSTGVIQGLVEREGQTCLSVIYGTKKVEHPSDSWRKLSLSYAMTVHKSQGSEYDVVVMPITTAHYNMLRRNLFYTGVTRARKLCVIVGSQKAIRIAIDTMDGLNRQTTLLSRIRDLLITNVPATTEETACT